MSEKFVADEPCDVCNGRNQMHHRPVTSIDVTYGHVNVCRVCYPKLPDEWKEDHELGGNDDA